jgi:hypothetical protein
MLGRIRKNALVYKGEADCSYVKRERFRER